MNIGIITFHWATNYGAILQSLALQETLVNLGHNVEIINYKPKQYDDNILTFFRFRKFLHLDSYRINRRKEKKLIVFRQKYLIQTKRFTTLKKLKQHCNHFDALITGSDQVLNPSFLMSGEIGGSTAYFLDFGNENCKRIAYAASFGTTDYESRLCDKVRPLIKRFNAVSTRESTGLKIFNLMGADNPIIVPDPTILHNSEFYDKLLGRRKSLNYRIRAYILHNRENAISKTLREIDAEIITDQGLESWINAIKSSTHFITNSFHGVVFCLLYHIPFSVALKTKENIGMNDRFYTLLGNLCLTDRIFSEAEFNSNCMNFNHNWNKISQKLQAFRNIGIDFLSKTI